MADGITSFGTINLEVKCAYPGCPNRIVRQRVTDKYCKGHRGKHTLEYVRRAEHDVTFIMIDGEGQGDGSAHKYVLLACGNEQLERPDGFTDIIEIFEFLYEQFRANPDACFAGFYLGYDYNMWLKLLPRDRAYYLLTDKGRAKRKRVCRCTNLRKCKHARIAPHPVEYRGWQFDILGYKRLRLRPKSCHCVNATCKCPGQNAWMYINDAGPFFQASLLSVIDPGKWTEPIVTPDESATVSEGKSRRSSAVLDD